MVSYRRVLLRFLGLGPRVPALIHCFKEIWISLDKLPSLWMLTQSARPGERGSIPEGSQRPSMYSQTIFFSFFPESEIPPQIPQHLCVKICIYISGKINPGLCILKQNAWAFRHTDGPASHQAVCCSFKSCDSFFQESLGLFTYHWVF